MTSMQIFERYEKKFVITDEKKKKLLECCKDRLVNDKNGNSDGSYKVYSLYFDDKYQNIIRTSTSKPLYKEKMRVRCYGRLPEKGDVVYLEIKKKYQNRGNKRRIKMTYQDCLDYLNKKKRLAFDDYVSEQVIKEIDYYLKQNNVSPACFISSERIAYFDKDDETLRITFDRNIITRTVNPNLDSESGENLIDDDTWVMEVKFNRAIPLWFVQILSNLEIYNQPFSKYGKTFIKEKQNHQDISVNKIDNPKKTRRRR
ncbi:MAG: polyphosphate polymerase domain-containing protein [Bacilli bacterium]|nr:polyphosphate polymerase domain-containing protein [Bacilli bacterium]